MSGRLPDRRERRRRTPAVPEQARTTFLEALATAYSVTHAAALAGVHRRRLYELKDADEEFAAAWDDAYQQGADVIRDEIRRRAVEGWDEPVYQGGKLVGHVRRYSDRLLELEAKRRDPAYRERFEIEGGQPTVFVLDSLLERARRADDAGEMIEGELVEPPALGEGSS